MLLRGVDLGEDAVALVHGNEGEADVDEEQRINLKGGYVCVCARACMCVRVRVSALDAASYSPPYHHPSFLPPLPRSTPQGLCDSDRGPV